MAQQQRQRGFAARRQHRQKIQKQIARQQERKQRQQERFTEPNTPRSARRTAQALAKLETRPLERQIKSEVRASAKREGDIGQWYGQLADSLSADQAAAQQAFSTAQAAQTQRLNDEAARAKTGLAGIAEGDKSFAALVGGPTNSKGLAEMANAVAAAERQRTTLAAPLGAIGANYIASIGPRRNAAVRGGIEARQGERERRRKQQQDLQAVQRERGSSVVKNLQTLREQDQDYSTQRQVTGAKEGYNRALEQQSKLGYKGKVVSANAQKQAAAIYASADMRGATAQEEVARLNREGKHDIAKALEEQARINSKSKKHDSGGYNVKEAKSFLRENFGKKRVSAQQAIDYLVNRGVSYGVAQKAVRQLAKG